MEAFCKIIKVLFILVLIIGFYFQHNLGLADNGDFTRIMTWFTSGPIGIEPNWPSPNTQEWQRRFFNYWLPYWKLDFPGKAEMKSSSLLLWLPGVLLNYYLVSPHILYLHSLSLFPKFLLVLYLLLVFYWIDTSELNNRVKMPLYITVCIPLILMFVNTDYVAYFNSFYCETASIIFLFTFLVSLIFLKRQKTLIGLFAAVVSLLMLSTAKASTFYWPLIAVPFIFSIWGFTRKLVPYLYLGLLVLIATALCFISALITRPPEYIRINNYYNSLFYGVLTFSHDPSTRLAELKLSKGIQFIDYSAYTSEGREGIKQYGNRMSPLNTLRVISKEPAIMIKITKYIWENMQVTFVKYLGKLPQDHPKISIHNYSLLNLWSHLKIKLFPRGDVLGLILLLYTMISIYAIIRTTGISQELGILGLITTIGTIIDMYIAVLGDGKWEIVKHLFLSNVLFDLSSIAAINIIVVVSMKFFENHKPHLK